MNYVIQEGLFKGNHEERLVNTLNKFGFPVFFFKHIPFSEDLVWIQKDPNDPYSIIPGVPPVEKNVMAFGSVKFSHFVNKYGWNPGSFYNKNHDYLVYSKYWGENMLNFESKIQKLIDPVQEKVFFARPTGDTKIFKGEVYDKEMWNYCVEAGIANGVNPEELIQICTPKMIMQEIRCFVVKGKVITASFYKIGDRIVYQNCQDEDILTFAQDMVDIYQLADAFVIDVCRTKDGLKIVECNCINFSGFYNIDEKKLIVSLEENFSI